jgi:IPT/TIG domain-containing protein
MAKLNMSLLQSDGLRAKLKPPTVTAISPTFGVEAGGTAVTITGTRFKAGAQASIGGVACTGEVVVSKTSMTAVTGAHAAAENVDVVVTNPNGQSGTGVGLYDYAAPPTVASILPVSGDAAGGTAVTVAGTGFRTGAICAIDGVPLTAVAVAPDGLSLTGLTGAHVAAAGLDVVVTNTDGQSGTGLALYEYT